MSDYLICYDISDPKRLGRIHREMKRWALPIQYSVFLYSGDNRTLAGHLKRISRMVNDRNDDLRCYPLPARGLRQRMGRATLPQGIVYTDLPSEDSYCY